MLRTMLLCVLTAAVFFLPFYLIDGGFFHYAGDFNSQQISFYRYMNGFIKGGGYPDGMAGAARNTFSWATDLGSGAMNAYSFYLYGSPFFWLSLIFPQNWLPYLMVPLLILKFAVAGGGAYRYLPLRPPHRLCDAGRLPVCILGLQRLQCLFQPLCGCGGPLPVDALGAG